MADGLPTGVQFERETAKLLGDLGWETEFTPVTGDGGVDLIARSGSDVMVVQCKDWTNPVGTAALQEVHLARSLHRATLAVVVSRAGYTSAAREHAERLAAVGQEVHLLRPADLELGCVLDRRAEGKLVRARRNAARQEAAWRETEARRARDWTSLVERWAAHDRAVLAYNAAKLKYEDRLFILFAWSAALPILYAWLSSRASDGGAVTAAAMGAGIGWVHGFVVRHPGSEPAPPTNPRPAGAFTPTRMPDFEHDVRLAEAEVNGRQVNAITGRSAREDAAGGESRSAGTKGKIPTPEGVHPVQTPPNRRGQMPRIAEASRADADQEPSDVAVDCPSCASIVLLPPRQRGSVVCPICRRLMLADTYGPQPYGRPPLSTTTDSRPRKFPSDSGDPTPSPAFRDKHSRSVRGADDAPMAPCPRCGVRVLVKPSATQAWCQQCRKEFWCF